MDEARIKQYIIEMVTKTNDMSKLKRIYTFVQCWLVEE